MEQIKNAWQYIKGLATELYEILNTPFAHLGETAISVNVILYFLLSILLLLYLAKKSREVLVNRLLVRANIDEGIRQSIGTSCVAHFHTVANFNRALKKDDDT